MACYWLQNSQVNIAKIEVPTYDGHYAAAASPAHVLAPLINDAYILTNADRSQLADEYNYIVSRKEILRGCDGNGSLMFRDITVHDHLLIGCCTNDWLLAARVIGNAIGQSDTRNSLCDAFLSERLKWLIKTGLIEADGAQTAIRSFKVRLADASRRIS